MSDGSINFNKLSFFQKVEMAKESLSAQGKSSPSTADIVKEMVNMEKASKANNGTLPEGYTIEHTGGVASSSGPRRVAGAETFSDAIQEVYGTPVINNNLTKIAQMLERITSDETLSDEAKAEAVDILKEMVKLLTTGGEIPQALVDLVDDMAKNIINPSLVYGTPDINPKTNDLVSFVTKFLSSDVIPEDVKQKFMDIINNSDNLGGAEVSAQSMLVNALIKLAKDDGISRDALREIANLINAMGGNIVVTVNEDTISIQESDIIEMLYGTPDIANPKFVKFKEFVSRILSSDLPDEVKDAVKELMGNPSSIGTAASSVEELVLNTIRQLIDKNNLSSEELQKLIDIANTLGLSGEIKPNDIFDTVIMVYDAPDINPILNDPNVKVALDFLNGFMSSQNIPDDIKTKFQEIIKNSIQDYVGKDMLPAEVLIDLVNKLLAENELDDNVRNEIENLLKDAVEGLDDDIFTGNVCVYDTPEIRFKRALIVMDIIEKLTAEDSNIPPELKEELFQLLRDILHNLTDEDKMPDGIEEILDNKTISDTLGTKKAFVSKDTNIEEKYPPDKFEILAKVPQDSKTIMVVFRKK